MAVALIINGVSVDPPLRFSSVPLKVKFDSPSKVLAVPDPVIILLSALLFIVVEVTPVRFEPSPYKVSNIH